MQWMAKAFVYFFLALTCLMTSFVRAQAADPDLVPLKLAWNPFVGNPMMDQDLDCLDDRIEHQIAMHFRPLFIYDSRENARRPGEPAVLYRVSTGIDRRVLSCDKLPDSILIRYAALHADDGGFATSTFCRNSHYGDNQVVGVWASIENQGTLIKHQTVVAGGDWWPSMKMIFYLFQHPVVFYSAGKHHEYLDRSKDGKGYPAWYGCREGIDGRGARVFSVLENAKAPRGWLNVGERLAHPPMYFVGALDFLGYRGEHSWGVTPFCGGHPLKYCENSGATSPMAEIWGD